MYRITARIGLKAAMAAAVVVGLHLGAPAAARADSSVYVDSPRAHSVVAPDFHLGGWAIDWAARQSTGVMTIHVWAYPASGAPPIFLGVPSTGSRHDIAVAFGQHFLNCGFGLNVRGLAPGDYVIAVFPYSEFRKGFDYNSAVGIPISVRKPTASAPKRGPTPAPKRAPKPAPTPAADPTPTPDPSGGVKLRVLMWNLHHGVGTDGKYNLDRIATWMAKMNPDVIVLNEVEKYTWWGNEDQPARYKALLEAKTGRKWYSHFSQEFGQWNSKGKGHQILSVYPFESAGHADITKSNGLKGAGAISQAGIMVNGRLINVLLTHLDPYDKGMRLRQARDAIRYAEGFAENRLITGDMNAWPDQSSIAEFNRTYDDSWTVAERKGTAHGVRGISPSGATKKGRIDYIFVSKRAPHLSVLASKVYDTRDANGRMPSDHRPVVTTFLVK